MNQERLALPALRTYQLECKNSPSPPDVLQSKPACPTECGKGAFQPVVRFRARSCSCVPWTAQTSMSALVPNVLQPVTGQGSAWSEVGLPVCLASATPH
eukprot:6274122-Amphidinium_carterae.1